MLALGLCACMDLSDYEGERPISTHVGDWRDQVVYQLMVDRFANGDLANDYRIDRTAPARWHGGDWRGVEDHLGYLEHLGVTALWISPIVKNVETDAGVDGYHGYWAQDLTQLNPHFGDLATLRRMIDAAHGRGMLVILDIVTNHLGQLFYYDMNLNGQPDERVEGAGKLPSPPPPAGKDVTSAVGHVNEYDPDFDPRGVQAWTSLGEAGPAPITFVYDAATNHMPPQPGIFQEVRAYNRRGKVYDWNDREQVEKGDFPGGLKDVNTLDPDVQSAMIDVFARWIELTDADGFRIDTVKHVEHEFWQKFAPALRSRLAAQGKKNFFMFGEAFDGDDALVGSYTFDGEVDSTFYFPQHFTAFRDVFQDGKSTDRIETLFQHRAPGGDYATEPHPNGIGVAPNHALVGFIDNHDVGRFLYFRHDVAALENALTFLFAEDGIPCVYYGTEQGFAGGNDPANREDLWLSAYDESAPLFTFIGRLSRIRRAYPALTRGNLSIVWSTSRTGAEEDAGIFAFERTGGDAGKAYSLVVLNTHAGHDSHTAFQGAAMKVSAAAGTKLRDVLHAEAAAVAVAADGTLTVSVPATSAVVLVPEADVIAGL